MFLNNKIELPRLEDNRIDILHSFEDNIEAVGNILQ